YCNANQKEQQSTIFFFCGQRRGTIVAVFCIAVLRAVHYGFQVRLLNQSTLMQFFAAMGVWVLLVLCCTSGIAWEMLIGRAIDVRCEATCATQLHGRRDRTMKLADAIVLLVQGRGEAAVTEVFGKILEKREGPGEIVMFLEQPCCLFILGGRCEREVH